MLFVLFFAIFGEIVDFKFARNILENIFRVHTQTHPQTHTHTSETTGLGEKMRREHMSRLFMFWLVKVSVWVD